MCHALCKAKYASWSINLKPCLLCQVASESMSSFTNVQVCKELFKIEFESVRVSTCWLFISTPAYAPIIGHVYQFLDMLKATFHFFALTFTLTFDVVILLLSTQKIFHFKDCAYAHSTCESAKIVCKSSCKVIVSFDIPIASLASTYGFVKALFVHLNIILV